jgi:hypothetical protein
MPGKCILVVFWYFYCTFSTRFLAPFDLSKANGPGLKEKKVLFGFCGFLSLKKGKKQAKARKRFFVNLPMYIPEVREYVTESCLQ